MGIESSSPYLPKSRIGDYLTFVKRGFAYRVWGECLEKYGEFNVKSQFKFLDVGSGPGYFLRYIEKWFPKADLCGLDSDKSLIDFSSRHLTRTTLVHHDGHSLPFPDSSFNVVSSLQVIEHLETPMSFLREVNRVLGPKGILLISTPNPEGICSKVLAKKWQGIRYDHISLKSPAEWRNIFKKAGFNVIQDGTTGLTGFKILQVFPFSLLNHIPMAVWGFFPWDKGESYMAIIQKN